MINAVAFDYGGVSCEWPADGTRQRLADMIGVSLGELVEYDNTHRKIWDAGEINGAEFYLGAFAYFGVSGAGYDREKAAEMARIDQESWKHINQETIRLMEDLKKAGVRVAILSNMPFDFLDWLKVQPVIAIPDAAIFSCEEHCNKPDEPIYRTLLTKLGLPPGEVVFFDDMPLNVEGARGIGMNAYVWKDPDAARKTLATLGIKGAI
jgi:putative hydrolase of the HAD superfamily